MGVIARHRETGEERRFPRLEVAEAFAERHGGGVDQWTYESVPARDPAWGLPAAMLPGGAPKRRSSRRTHG